MTGRKTVSILGAGSFATALACVAGGNGWRVNLWDRDEALVRRVRESGENTAALPGVKLPESVAATGDLRIACEGAPVLVLAAPAHELARLVEEIGGCISGEQIIITTAQGFSLHNGTVRRPSQTVLAESLAKKVGALCGPAMPREVAQGQPAGAVIASPFGEAAAAARRAFTTRRFQIFESSDLAGVEIGAAMSGIYAAAAGIACGIGFGASTRALVAARGLAEMAHLGAALGAKPATFSGLSGLGNLFAQATSELSPYFALGKALGGGASIEAALAEAPECSEGLHTMKAAGEAARALRVPMPILFGVAAILEGRRGARETAMSLVAIEAGREVDMTIDASGLELPVPGAGPKGGAGKG